MRAILIYPDSTLEEVDLDSMMDLDDVADMLEAEDITAELVDEMTLWVSKDDDGDINELAQELIYACGNNDDVEVFGSALLVATDDNGDITDVTNEHLYAVGIEIS